MIKLCGHFIHAYWNEDGSPVWYDLQDLLVAVGQPLENVWRKGNQLGGMLYHGKDMPPSLLADASKKPALAAVGGHVLVIDSDVGKPLHKLLQYANYLNGYQKKVVASTNIATSYLRGFACTGLASTERMALVSMLIKQIRSFETEVRKFL